MTGTISFQEITHTQLLEKVHDFTELLGRSPKLTVRNARHPNMYDVTDILDTGLVVCPTRRTKAKILPIDGVYTSIAMF